MDNLHCESDFLRVNGSGTLDQLTGSVTISLQQLTDELGRFVDLGGLVLAGDGSGKLQWSRNAAGDFETSGQLDLHNFQLSIPQRQPMAEENLTIVLAVKGHADLAAPDAARRGHAAIRSGGDQSISASCSRLPI